MRDRHDDDSSGSHDDETRGGGGADHSDGQRMDPSKNYRFRHSAYEHFGVESYVWGIAVALSVIEGLYVATSVALIVCHVGTQKHWDMVRALTFICTASVTINIVFFLGAMKNRADASRMFAWITFLIFAAAVADLALAIVGTRTHILLLTDPHPEKHRYLPVVKKHHHSGHRRGHSKRSDDDSEEA
ncbi:hypothetical protein JCM3770_003044 [Rhodotorula araucariae]